MTESTSAPVRRNGARHRFEIEVDGQVAGFIVYRQHDDVLELVHTEVQPEFEGRGLAGQLARFALDQARAAGQRVKPTCPYVAAYIARHPQDQDLVAA
ncbi:MAG: GNAT family N-acetyltransferase [Ramlibacter sp.]